MFLKLSEHLEKTMPLRRVYKGIVVSNTDPKKYGRVKVKIIGLLEGDTALLPWTAPNNPAFLGGSTNSQKLSVPEVGSELEIRFPFENIYMPFYYGYWHSATTHAPEFDANYPNSYGFKDSIGNIFRINKTLKTLFINIIEKIQILSGKDIELISTDGHFLGKGTTEARLEAPIIKLGDTTSFHATLAENVMAYNDAHIHPEQQPANPFTAPPLVPMSAKAGTVMDITALNIFLKGN